jgi:integrative and conjugative element protein (TIGR02256 family)
MSSFFVISKIAYESIRRDCLRRSSNETGGLLVGTRLGPDLVVPFVVPAGPGATQQRTRFEPDFSWQQHFLDFLADRFRSRHARLDYIGDWHCHPGALDQPSHRDWQTARQIVTDPAWGKIEAAFPIAVVEKGNPRLRAFVACRYRQNFLELPIEVVPDNDPRIQAVLFEDDRLVREVTEVAISSR